MSARERLETELNQAVAREDYEKAAELRDALKRLKD
jgi:protein-arginine kinase activator protein McsA